MHALGCDWSESHIHAYIHTYTACYFVNQLCCKQFMFVLFMLVECMPLVVIAVRDIYIHT
jgi:hypothetical protein